MVEAAKNRGYVGDKESELRIPDAEFCNPFTKSWNLDFGGHGGTVLKYAKLPNEPSWAFIFNESLWSKAKTRQLSEVNKLPNNEWLPHMPGGGPWSPKGSIDVAPAIARS